MSTVRGELICGNCSSYQGFTVELHDNIHRQIATGLIGPNGSFEMPGVAAGNYTLTVRSGEGETLHSEHLVSNAFPARVNVRLPPETQKGSVLLGLSGSVSLHRLSHKVPRSARKEYEKSIRVGNDHEQAILHLVKAVAIDPEFVEALNNLGSRYIATKRPAEALKVLQQAIDVDSGSDLVLTNFAMASMALSNFADAERAARRACQVDAGNSGARYLLGLSLYGQQKLSPEAVRLLETSHIQFPSAKIALAWIHAKPGHPLQAKDYLKQYLDTGLPERRDQVQRLLSSWPK
ncbi:MAG: tetratricopeptide repeat protein [Bryobacteraceae bacterium]|nr:tetratricopeptide repeat protein [Bryobacteraceae bacterium]